MKKHKILVIGDKPAYDQYKLGRVPSHWLYGAIEMEKDGHDVVCVKESSSLFNDLKYLIKTKPDIVFIPNLNLHNHILLLLLVSLNILKIPVYAYLHHEPAAKQGIKAKIYRKLLTGLKYVFFLSELSMQNTINADLIDADLCSVPGWGPDMDFYGKVETSDSGTYVSTGKENRDFDLLIEVFRRNGLPLHILTSKSHNGEDHTVLVNKCRYIPNIKLTLRENSPESFGEMLKAMASARALVCPLKQDKLNYCVGLSTITDAEGLGKPLILTENPYHADREGEFLKATTIEEWEEAVKKVEAGVTVGPSRYSMASAYQRMKQYMNL